MRGTRPDRSEDDAEDAGIVVNEHNICAVQEGTITCDEYDLDNVQNKRENEISECHIEQAPESFQCGC